MFRSILVPLDGTPEAATPLRLVRTIAQSTSGAIHLLRVTPATSATLTSEAAAYLEQKAYDLRKAGVRVDINVRHGEPGAEIVHCASSLAVDLITMATRAIGTRSMLALTSVARYVVTESPCPVLLLRAGGILTDHVQTLLVPVDGSPGGSLALAAARALAHAARSHIVLLDVVVPIGPTAVAALPGMTVGRYIDPAWESLAVAGARQYVEGLARSLASTGLAREARVATGEVGTEILRCANAINADIVVMSTYAVPWPARALLGSVADQVLRDGDRPVLLVRREAAACEAKPDNTPPIARAGA